MKKKEKEILVEDLSLNEQIIYGYWETCRDIQEGFSKTR